MKWIIILIVGLVGTAVLIAWALCRVAARADQEALEMERHVERQKSLVSESQLIKGYHETHRGA